MAYYHILINSLIKNVKWFANVEFVSAAKIIKIEANAIVFFLIISPLKFTNNFIAK